jgi:hypothetical protein
MEEYENKVNYLRHLKKIAEIRGGNHKSSVTASGCNLTKSSTYLASAGTK